MTPIRVLVVDDSVVVRRLVVTVLEEEADIKVVGVAANGRIALEKLESLTPDVITLDIEMPEMDGLETLREVRKRFPRLPVVMFSTLTERGASATLDALAAGANDFVTKPANVGSITAGMAAIRSELIPKVKALSNRVPKPTSPHGLTAAAVAPVAKLGPSAGSNGAAPQTLRVSPNTQDTRVVVIGVSTGGPNALAAMWPALALPTVPIVIVQHMPPVFTAMLAARLNKIGTVPVTEAIHGDVLTPGRAWIAPGDYHLCLEKSGAEVRIELNQNPAENSCRPSVDPLFRSAAAVYGPSALAVMLTGMGSDGLQGTRAIREMGGSVIAQDEATSVVWGMPGAVINAGLSDAVLSLAHIAPEINRRTMRSIRSNRSKSEANVR